MSPPSHLLCLADTVPGSGAPCVPLCPAPLSSCKGLSPSLSYCIQRRLSRLSAGLKYTLRSCKSKHAIWPRNSASGIYPKEVFSTHSSSESSTMMLIIEHLLRARPCALCWGYSGGQSRLVPWSLPLRSHLSNCWGTIKQIITQINIQLPIGMARKWFQYVGCSRLLPTDFVKSTSVPRNLGECSQDKTKWRGGFEISVEGCYTGTTSSSPSSPFSPFSSPSPSPSSSSCKAEFIYLSTNLFICLPVFLI